MRNQSEDCKCDGDGAQGQKKIIFLREGVDKVQNVGKEDDFVNHQNAQGGNDEPIAAADDAFIKHEQKQHRQGRRESKQQSGLFFEDIEFFKENRQDKEGISEEDSQV